MHETYFSDDHHLLIRLSMPVVDSYSTCLGCVLCCLYKLGVLLYVDGLMQERRNSIDNPLELRLSCTNPSIYGWAWSTRTRYICRPHKTKGTGYNSKWLSWLVPFGLLHCWYSNRLFANAITKIFGVNRTVLNHMKTKLHMNSVNYHGCVLYLSSSSKTTWNGNTVLPLYKHFWREKINKPGYTFMTWTKNISWGLCIL